MSLLSADYKSLKQLAQEWYANLDPAVDPTDGDCLRLPAEYRQICTTLHVEFPGQALFYLLMVCDAPDDRIFEAFIGGTHPELQGKFIDAMRGLGTLITSRVWTRVAHRSVDIEVGSHKRAKARPPRNL